MSTISKNGYFRPFYLVQANFWPIERVKIWAKAKTNIWLEADFFYNFYKYCFIAVQLIERLL